MSAKIKAYAVSRKGGQLRPFEYEPEPLGDEEVEIAVEYCGLCHSDLSLIDDEWGMSKFPLVPGHEVIGKVVAAGEDVHGAKVGQRVGLGWTSETCMHCQQCMSGDHNLCQSREGTIVGRHGGFAERVRCHWAWAIPLPEALDPKSAGPLFCGGITAFNPIVQANVQPTDRAGVIGIGGLGHLAVQFLNKWGCEVTAFTSSDSKRDEAMKLGAHHVVNSRHADQLESIAGSLDFIVSTVNVPLPWEAIIGTLAPRGQLTLVGAVPEPIPVSAFGLFYNQKSIAGSVLGSPATTNRMLDFCARHEIAPVIEMFPMSKANDAIQHLREGKARYRIVLENDFGK